MFEAFVPGFLLSLSLILAIGAQNAFVLCQGLRREHVFWVCLVCGMSDAILIVGGVFGFGTLASQLPWFEAVMRYAGAAFLLWYGWRNARAAWEGGHALQAEGQTGRQLLPTLVTLLGLTWLNPHVYLDTFVLIGSISAHYDNRVQFGAGAVLASISFFFALGYGARILAPLFARPISWRILDGLIALTMWTLAAGLLWA